jgi:hypothetical protein
MTYHMVACASIMQPEMWYLVLIGVLTPITFIIIHIIEQRTWAEIESMPEGIEKEARIKRHIERLSSFEYNDEC